VIRNDKKIRLRRCSPLGDISGDVIESSVEIVDGEASFKD
jgi:hypothetical protein